MQPIQPHIKWRVVWHRALRKRVTQSVHMKQALGRRRLATGSQTPEAGPVPAQVKRHGSWASGGL